MKKLAFWLFLVVTKIIGIIPFRLLYLLSDGISFLMHHLSLYRNKIVRINIANSFPEFTKKEVQQISRKYYRNIIDILLETLKSKSLSKKRFLDICTVKNPELIEYLLSNNKSVFLALGHCGNWEILAQYFSLTLDYKTIALYKKLSNEDFDNFTKQLRQQWKKVYLYESRSAYRLLAAEKDIPKAVIIAGDQTPSGLETDYWCNFLNQDTPFFTGLEKMSQSLNYAVVFLDVSRVARGKYEINLIPICDEGQKTQEFEISAQYARLLEKTIQNQPDNWLWSHRRWKHKRMKAAHEA